jgi:hypothetical protein
MVKSKNATPTPKSFNEGNSLYAMQGGKINLPFRNSAV